MSNGSSRLEFRDPDTFKVTRVISVRDGRRPVGQLNELEYSGGKIYANRLGYDYIYEIDPDSGNIEGIIDLTNIWPARERPRDGLLNGMAIDPVSRKILVTGKFCPKIYEIELERL
jgi:glutaminyl-peptide cyclotransferase